MTRSALTLLGCTLVVWGCSSEAKPSSSAQSAGGESVAGARAGATTTTAGQHAIAGSGGAPSAEAGAPSAEGGAAGLAAETGGRAGESGAGGESGSGCEPDGPEQCFNGIDDDCNGATDCDDVACLPTAECVPLADGSVGTTVAADSDCPDAFPVATALMQGLNAPSDCTGCACEAGPVSCTAKVSSSASNGSICTFGQETQTISTECTPTTFLAGTFGLFGNSDPHAECLVSGSPSVAKLSWAHRTKFCGTNAVGTGCSADEVCAPKAARHCTLSATSSTCSANYTLDSGQAWFTGADDTRSCGATCECAAPISVSCGLAATAFSDSTCTAGGGQEGWLLAGYTAGSCDAPLYPVLSARIISASATCAAPSNAQSGHAIATGAHAVCCND